MKTKPRKLLAAALGLVIAAAQTQAAENGGSDSSMKLPLWQTHDFSFTNSTAAENPFAVPFSAEITGPGAAKLVLPGFYDGDGIWKIRVSPTAQGEWQLVTRSTVPALDGQRVRFACTPNLLVQPGNRLKRDDQRTFPELRQPDSGPKITGSRLGRGD